VWSGADIIQPIDGRFDVKEPVWAKSGMRAQDVDDLPAEDALSSQVM
jgi:hypothetical protein